ncbi:J domain-containing protein [Candidatus Saccharibacteria bacterium]|nr:J domain-containing protein [Candidatus Saccharibacteria bacterium]
MNTLDCLQLLGINSKPTKAVIKKAFRQAALNYHPDTKGTDKEFIHLKSAYDKLMALTSEELANIPFSGSDHIAQYNPFNDSLYNERVFFQPDNPATEGFERKLRARGCPYCSGMGYVTKNTDPSKGFIGRERRYCKCQWV